MKKLILLFTALVVLASYQVKQNLFTGKIHYKYSFTDLHGNDLNEQLTPHLGAEQDYFINASNYKSYSGDRLQQLYNAETNSYYFFAEPGVAQKFDAATATSQKYAVTKLDRTEKIAGYACKAIQVDTDEATTIYYYSPLIKTDRKAFSNHNFGEWNKYLEATEGALPLKTVMNNKQYGYIWTSTATEVAKMDLQVEDFALPENTTLK